MSTSSNTGTASLRLSDPGLLKQQCLVDGAWRDAAGGETIAVTNPADGSTVAHVPVLSPGEV